MRPPLGSRPSRRPPGGQIQPCRKLSYVNISSRLLSAIPRPSVRLFLGLCFLSALMMIGFLIIRASHDDAAARHSFDTSVHHSKG
jgi:hypothetical protein